MKGNVTISTKITGGLVMLVIPVIATVAEENTTRAQEVAASTEQVSRSVLNITDKEKEVSETIKSLISWLHHLTGKQR